MQILVLSAKEGGLFQQTNDTKDNNLLLCVGYSFLLICNSMNEFKYILFLKRLAKITSKRFLVTSNKKTAFDVQVAPANLNFAVYTLFPSTFVAILSLRFFCVVGRVLVVWHIYIGNFALSFKYYCIL